MVLDRRSRAGQAYNNIVRRLEGIDVPFLSLEERAGFPGSNGPSWAIVEGGTVMIEFFKQFWQRDTDSSRQIAKERLRLVLVHDRVNVSQISWRPKRRSFGGYLQVHGD